MRTDQPTPIRLADYQAFAFAIDSTVLDFQLEPSATKVRAVLQVRRTGDGAAPLRLDGVRLKLLSVAIDGEILPREAYELTEEALILTSVPDQFELTTEVVIDPAANVALEGLYMSGGRFCSQCEAEGFRKVTYFPDRPDVLSRYTVRMEADAKAFPRLLSNGNLVEHGPTADGNDHEQVQIIFTAKGLLIPSHRALEGVHRIDGAAGLAGVDIDAQIDGASGHGHEAVGQLVQFPGNEREQIAGLGEGVVPDGIVTAVRRWAMLDQIAVG